MRIVSGGYHVVGASDVSLERTDGRLEEVLRDTVDILLWPRNETSDTLIGTAVCRAVQTVTCTFQAFSFLAYSVSITAKKACVTSDTVHTNTTH